MIHRGDPPPEAPGPNGVTLPPAVIVVALLGVGATLGAVQPVNAELAVETDHGAAAHPPLPPPPGHVESHLQTLVAEGLSV